MLLSPAAQRLGHDVPPTSSGETAGYSKPATVEGELARARCEFLDDVPTTTSEALAPLTSGATVAIEGQCTPGASVRFTVLTATPGDDGDTPIEGVTECEQPRAPDPATSGRQKGQCS